MEKAPRLVPTIYGYLVCLISIVVLLVSVSMIVGSLFNLHDPLRANGIYGGNSLSSLQSYKATLASPVSSAGVAQPALAQNEVQAAYDAAKNDQIAAVRFDAFRSVTTGGIMILIAFILFFTHWRWLGRLQKAA